VPGIDVEPEVRRLDLLQLRTRVESILQFLERSTEPVAVETRRRWDIWLLQLPPAARAALITRLEDRHDHLVRAALAELITLVLLDATYPAVEIEPETGAGSRTDFAVDQLVRLCLSFQKPSLERSATRVIGNCGRPTRRAPCLVAAPSAARSSASTTANDVTPHVGPPARTRHDG
jgi:hypothetical protein